MAETKYIPAKIEGKWQEKWSKDRLYEADLSKRSKKYYTLVELPYTSGDLHMGHWFTFTMGDIVARFKKMQNFNVVYPNGYDAFGLPAENAAIKNNVHPRDWTYANIERMNKQFVTMGSSIDWTKTVIACDPDYYRWNQWIFLKMFEKGLAYRGKLLSNWCPSCQTVLANENVEAGKCWRCGTEVVQKEIEQWFFKITDYADRLLWKEPPQADWPKPLREGQNQWIGKSEGVNIDYSVIANDSEAISDSITCFTTRPDTIFGATFIVLAPEHPFIASFLKLKVQNSKFKSEVQNYVKQSKKRSELERKESKEKTGVFTGAYVVNPLSNEKIPVWVADYVLWGYGTGAVMGVPAHDERDWEFAKKYDLEIRTVILGETRNDAEAYEGEGVLINSGEFTGLSSNVAREKISDYIEKNNLGSRKTQYHLHDWSISRQRYWGTPIPIIYCEKCGIVPVPEDDLPVELPYKVDYSPKGKAPLATAQEWVNVSCPQCGGSARREIETMDTFVDSSWYFFRYLDPQNKKKIFDKEVINDWMPIDIYIGGAEHTLGHALYSRFFTKIFYDLGLISFTEYAQKRVHHGVILGPDGHRMSKSRGNVINPDEQVKEYGADAVRMYLIFLGPYDITTPWNPSGIHGVYSFLKRVWELVSEHGDNVVLDQRDARELLSMQHKTIKRVTEDLEELKFNTAIAALMEYTNILRRQIQNSGVRCAEWDEAIRTLLLLLAPFAPHISEELWAKLGYEYSIHQKDWPKFDDSLIQSDAAIIPVQVNGRLRDTLLIQTTDLQDQSLVESRARDSEKIKKYLEGQSIVRVVYVTGKLINFVTK